MTHPSQSPSQSDLLASFGSELRVAVVGASGAIGGALAAELEASPRVARLVCLARRPPAGADGWLRLDLEQEDSIAASAEAVAASLQSLDLVIVATGVLHGADGLAPEKTWRALSAEGMEAAYRINAVGPALVAKHFLPLLGRERKAAFAALSARVGSISDNRLGGWHAYRASKAGLNMLIRTLSIELARRNPTALCVGLHPGTVDSGLSKPFQASVPDGKLFAPVYAARCLLGVLDGLDSADSGGLFAWDGRAIPA